MSRASPARSARRALHPTTRHPWIRSRDSACLAATGPGAVVVKNTSLPSHIAERLWMEVRHDEPGITAQSLDVGSEGREVLEPGWAGTHRNNDQIR